MAQIEGGFNAADVDPNAGFEAIPVGSYQVCLTESELKPTDSGYLIKFTVEILEGPYKGRKLFDRLNMKNANPTAVKIARATMSQICRAVGVMSPQDTAELHNRPLMAYVGQEVRKDTGDMGNAIKSYKAIGAGSPVSSNTGPGPAKGFTPQPTGAADAPTPPYGGGGWRPGA